MLRLVMTVYHENSFGLKSFRFMSAALSKVPLLAVL